SPGPGRAIRWRARRWRLRGTRARRSPARGRTPRGIVRREMTRSASACACGSVLRRDRRAGEDPGDDRRRGPPAHLRISVEKEPAANRGRLAQAEPEEKAIELRLGEWERSFELDRILGRDDEERIRKTVRGLVHGDLPLLHRFEEGRLRGRGRTVDLVDEDDVGGERAGPELEPLCRLVVDRH